MPLGDFRGGCRCDIWRFPALSALQRVELRPSSADFITIVQNLIFGTQGGSVAQLLSAFGVSALAT